jgi:hypothetical protein
MRRLRATRSLSTWSRPCNAPFLSRHALLKNANMVEYTILVQFFCDSGWGLHLFECASTDCTSRSLDSLLI